MHLKKSARVIGIRSLRKRVTSQTVSSQTSSVVLGRFANASHSIRKRNMNQRKSTEENQVTSTEENQVTFNHYK